MSMNQEEQLEHERLIAKLLEIRNPLSAPKPLVELWLNSTVMAALIGVVGTALLGAYVSGEIQRRAKENEQELARQHEVRAARAAAVEKALGVVGQNLNATDDLLVTVNNGYHESRHKAEDLPALREWKRQLAERRDKADSDWRQSRRSLGYTLVYSFEGDRAVIRAWDAIVNASDGYERCTRDWYWQNAASGSNDEVSSVCPREREAYESTIAQLTAIVSSR